MTLPTPTRRVCSLVNPHALTPKIPSPIGRFVRARILLEDPNVGAVASFDESLCVILCRFSRAEHSLLLPLWKADALVSKTFEELIAWHAERFHEGTRLSGAGLEPPDDRAAWGRIADGI